MGGGERSCVGYEVGATREGEVFFFSVYIVNASCPALPSLSLRRERGGVEGGYIYKKKENYCNVRGPQVRG